MNILKRSYLFLLYHQRKYRTILEYISSGKNLRDNDVLLVKYEAYCSYFTKNYLHAQSYFEKLVEFDKANSKDYNILASLYARHNDKEKAITTWCIALEKDSKNQSSKKALDYIRDQGGSINLMEDDFFDSVAGKEPFLIPLKLFFYSFLIVILAFLVWMIYLFGYNFIKEKIKDYNFKNRKELSNILLPNYNPNLLEGPKDKKTRYSYSEEEIKNKFEDIKKHILNYRPVQAQIEINQIKLSNASASVKLKMEALESFIDEPDYALFKNLVTYDDIVKEQQFNLPPFLYQNVYIKWEGRVVNFLNNKSEITFNLVLGDEEKGYLDAIIPVFFKKALIVKSNDIVAVFGKLKVTEKNIYIEGKYLIKNFKE